MSTSVSVKNANMVFESLASGLQETMDETKSTVTVFVGKAKMGVQNNFVLLFYQSFLYTIDEYNLSRNEIRTVLKILEYAQFGNLLQFSYTKLAKDLEMNKSNMSKIMKKLKETGLILDDDGNLFLNPQIIAKGSFLSLNPDQQTENLLDLGADALAKIGLEPNIKKKSQSREMSSPPTGDRGVTL